MDQKSGLPDRIDSSVVAWAVKRYTRLPDVVRHIRPLVIVHCICSTATRREFGLVKELEQPFG